jgi:predicted nucleotidyltransferase component of viral defense system
MISDLIQARLSHYNPIDKVAEENAIKEICQEIALAALSRSDFFRIGAFMGGTCLRILHGLQRFSEDLDFVLRQPDPNFNWSPYLHAIEVEFQAFGLACTAVDRSKANQTIKKAFLKEDSFGQVLQLQYTRSRSDIQKVLIKLEIDTQSPQGAKFDTIPLNYPYPFAVISHDLPSLFSGKCNDILTRPYTKGRDWYDFLWYARRNTRINFNLLQSSLKQYGPYSEMNIEPSPKWLVNELQKKVTTLDWKKARMDVDRFLSDHERLSLDLWGPDLFLSVIKNLESYL